MIHDENFRFSDKIKQIPSVVPVEETSVVATDKDSEEFEKRLQQLKA